MDKMNCLYVVLTTIFCHILFALSTAAIMLSLYFAAVDNDKSLLIITGLSLLGYQCIKGLWYFTKKEWADLRKEKR